MNELTSEQLRDAETIKKFQIYTMNQVIEQQMYLRNQMFEREAYMKELGITQERMGKITPADKITLTTDNVETVRTTKTMDLQWRKELIPGFKGATTQRLFQKVLVEKSINGIAQQPEEEWIEVPIGDYGLVRPPMPEKKKVIKLTEAEIQSGLNRVRYAENLILNLLAPTHAGIKTWLMNYGVSDLAKSLRANRNIKWVEETDSAETVSSK